MLSETSIKKVLEISLLALSNVKVKFDTRELNLRKYIIVKAMPTMLIAIYVKLINKHKFIETPLDKASKMFVVYVAALEVSILIMTVYSMRKLLLAALKQDKTPTEVPIEYSNFPNVFSLD